jgi:hypothetical protein
MNAKEAISALERLQEAVNTYINNLTGEERLLALDKQIKFAMEDEDHSLAMRHVRKNIELLLIKIKDKHCQC